MKAGYKIRLARKSDTDQVQKLVREAICHEKKCLDPMQVQADFIHEYVDKLIARGQMLVVENDTHELELIGEVHDYNDFINPAHLLKELSFISRMDALENYNGKELLRWLFSEIQDKHKDVFRVKMTTQVGELATIEYLRALGFTMSDKLNGRLNGGISHSLVPLSWMNPSFN